MTSRACSGDSQMERRMLGSKVIRAPDSFAFRTAFKMVERLGSEVRGKEEKLKTLQSAKIESSISSSSKWVSAVWPLR